MEHQQAHHPEAPAHLTPGDSAAAGAKHELVQEALATYHVCKDGTVVTNPADCPKAQGFPDLDISHLT